MDQGKKYIRLFLWGTIAYWVCLRFIYLHSTVCGLYIIGEIIWGRLIVRMIKKANLNEDVKNDLYEELLELGCFIFLVIALIFWLYEYFVLGFTIDREPYDWESRFNV